jgi:aminoglycoside phosphotransferase family enzyme
MDPWINRLAALHALPEWAGESLIQTHISAVLLGRDRVLKLKKPVNFGFLDYTTPEKRLAACQAEVALNSRLSPDVYLGVETLGAGESLDYGVLMKRLRRERMLDELVRRGEATEAMIRDIAATLADFHGRARRGPEVDRYGQIAVIAANWRENFTQTEGPNWVAVAPRERQRIRDWVEQELVQNAALFAARVTGGHIVDGHGDLRCESINVDGRIHIFDCIEFNERFRCGDVASEVAFLAMDLDARGRPDLGYYFVEEYLRRRPDDGLLALQPFYRCYRAFVRGKVAGFRLAESEFSAEEQSAARAEAEHYFALAGRYADRLREKTVIVVAGRSGAGKTAVARAIAGELGLRVVTMDGIRPDRCEERGPIDRAIAADGAVVLEGTFATDASRTTAHQLAVATGAKLRIVQCSLALEPWPRPEWGLGTLALGLAEPLPAAAHRATDWLRLG